MAQKGREKRTYFLKRGNRRCKRPTGLDGVMEGLCKQVCTAVAQSWGAGRIVKSLVEAFGLYPKWKRFK